MKPVCYRELDIDAPAATVWDVIKDPMNLHYMPSVKRVEVIDGGTTRLVTIDYSDIEGYEEDEFVAPEKCYNINHDTFSYNYTFTGPYIPIKDHVATVEVLPTGEDSSKFVWRCVWTLTEPLTPEEEQVVIDSVEGMWWGGMNRVKEIVEAK